MPSLLAEILKDELAAQRVFLSSDEEAALTHPAGHEDEHDLAWDRVKHRRTVFYGALRDRYIRDHRPLDEWRQMIADEEAAAGGTTFITQLATQVLVWAARTSDRGAMLGGFVAGAARWLGMLLMLLGGYAWYSGAAAIGVAVALVGLALYVTGRLVARRVAARTSELAEQVRG